MLLNRRRRSEVTKSVVKVTKSVGEKSVQKSNKTHVFLSFVGKYLEKRKKESPSTYCQVEGVHRF